MVELLGWRGACDLISRKIKITRVRLMLTAARLRAKYNMAAQVLVNVSRTFLTFSLVTTGKFLMFSREEVLYGI